MDGNLSASDVALLGDRNGADLWGGSAMMWIFALLILAGGGFGGFGGRGPCYQPQYATQDFVQNGFNFNDLQDQNRDILGAITNGTAQSVATTNQLFHDTTSALSDKYSELQRDIASLAVNQTANLANQNQCCATLTSAIEGVKYDGAMNTAAINANTTAQTQKILDAITGNRMADMQNQINQLQLQQAVSGVVRYPSASTYYAGNNPFCTCNCANM